MVRLPFPGDGSAKAMILAFEDGPTLQLFAVDLDPALSAFEPPIALSGGSAQLTALLLPRSLAEMRLVPGPLQPAAPPNRPLSELSVYAAFTTTILGAKAEAWSPIDAAGQTILEFPIPLDSDMFACPEFEQRTLGEYPWGFGSVLLTLADGGAFAAHGTTALRIAADGTITETATVPPVSCGTNTSTTIYLLADRTYRVEVDPIRLTAIGELNPEVGEQQWISAGSNGEIFSFSGTGQFGYFDGASWRLIDTLPVEGDGVSKGGALWLGPGEGAVANPAQARLTRWDGEVHLDLVGENAIGFGAATTTTRFGPVVIDTRFGGIYRYEGRAQWTLVPIQGAPPEVEALTEYGGGLAWGSQAGTVGLATPDGDCGSEPGMELSKVHALTRLGDGLLVGGEDTHRAWRWVLFRPRQK